MAGKPSAVGKPSAGGQSSGSKARRKRGMVLLVVVSLLALFVLMGVAYAIVASHALHTAQSNQRIQEVGDPPEREVDLILGQILYDTVGRSSLRGHSLLSDLYGNDSVRGVVTMDATGLDTYTPPAQPQVWRFTANATAGIFSQTPGYYSGRVITFLTGGNAAGHSTRVVEYLCDPTTGIYTFFVEAIASRDTTFVRPLNFDTFIVNGAAFNGAGLGFNPATNSMDSTYDPDGTTGPLSPRSVSLLPHLSGYDLDPSLLDQFVGTVEGGGADEPWDAVDYQNLLLAMVAPITAERHADSIVDNDVPVIPSMYRPELIRYWMARAGSMPEFSGGFDPYSDQNARNFMRTFIARPMPWDHPNFSGSNPYFAYGNADWTLHIGGLRRNPADVPAPDPMTMPPIVANFWDVDNDNDGVPDSVWIDPGLPVITSADGRRYKRLVALLVKDMDGRADLNAHGNFSQVSGASLPSPLGLWNGTLLTRGLGFGPAEVNLLGILGNDTTVYGNMLASRYTSSTETTLAAARPGQAGLLDPISDVKFNGVPNDYANLVPPSYSWYASHPDMHGDGAIVLDHAGQPITGLMGQLNEVTDNPYEMSQSGEFNNVDQPFSMAEGEALLRMHDQDISQPSSRPFSIAGPYLWGTQGAIDLNHARRERLRIHGSSLPVAMMSIPREVRGTMANIPTADGGPKIAGNTSILDIYSERLAVGLGHRVGGTPLTPVQRQQINTEMRKIVPWEFFHGRKLDLNRWLGDGEDGNGNGTPDEPSEAFAGEQAWRSPTGFGGLPARHNNGVDANNDGIYTSAVDQALARHLLARHLFCLGLAIADSGFSPPFSTEIPALPIAEQQELTLKRLAQWAINVVDFRDADAIMTPFEYDANPWNGWTVDGIVGSADDGTEADRRLVWGLEQPDLLLMESTAFHDRRLKDTAFDNDMMAKVGAAATEDDDVDQFRIPQGSMFLELYCPRASQSNNPRFPRELYSFDMATNEWRLDLGRIHPAVDANNVRHPVWQIAISEQTLGHATLGDFTPLERPIAGGAREQPESTTFDPNGMNPFGGDVIPTERLIWFANYEPPAMTFEGDRAFVNSLGWDVSLKPGQYAVVGPRPATYMGSRDDGDPAVPWDGDSSQGVLLKTLDRTNPNDTGVEIRDTTGTVNSGIAGTGIRSVVGIVADMRPPDTWMNPDRRVGLNISEPLPIGNYYSEPNPTDDARVPPDAYDDLMTPANTLPDAPYDAVAGRPLEEYGMTLYQTNTYQDVRSVFLQRLANPLEPFHSVTNPYITMDWMTIDLSVFNGEENLDRQVGGRDLDPNDPTALDEPDFSTRERGQTANRPNANPWPAESIGPQDTVAGGDAENWFRHSLDHSLGYVNSFVANPRPAPPQAIGDPDYAFPWLTWNNRPFASPHELMVVPTSSASRLGWEFQRLPQIGTPVSGLNPYDSDPAAGMYKQPFGHMYNFFFTGNNAGESHELHRILDYVEIPSPYVGAERWYNPNRFDGAGSLQPPFSKVSRFRDAGKINVNTILDEQVVYAAVGNAPQSGAATLADLTTSIFRSRQGYGLALLERNDAYPTYFVNPFRSADSADLMPPGLGQDQPVNATLLRPSPHATDARQFATSPGIPLLQMNDVAGQWTEEFRHIRRNPYFRYQGYQKLGNIFSTQSNVYAVWMTVGYFEVEPVAGWDTMPNAQKAAYPDRYTLGPEIGSETGEVVRHRAFFMIDRSVPVGFAPGQKLNTDDCVLLRRLIE